MSVRKNDVSFKQGTMIATLLGCSALYLPLTAEAATASAKTSWAVSRVASASMGSYCTMAQKYSDDTVLTFAQNTKGEYSLAFDFKDAKFKADQKQSITIGVDGGKSKSFDVIPQNTKTAVLAIGKDADFISKISSADKVSVKIDGAATDFAPSEFADGQKEMNICVDALNKPAEPAAEMVAEKQTKTTSPKAVINKSEIVLTDKRGGNEPSVEGLLAAMPKPSADITPVEDIVPVTPIKQEIAAKTQKADDSDIEVAALRNENARLARALSEQRKSFEDKQSSVEGAALSEARQKLDSAINENNSLRDQLDKMSAQKEAPKPDTNTTKLVESMKVLQQENQTLKNQIQIYSNTKNSKDSGAAANAEQLAKIQSENEDLKLQIADLKATRNDKPVVTADAGSDIEVNKLRADNRKLDSELSLLKTERESLATQVSSLQKDVEGKQLKMSGGSWDLEQATRRYQESQREIVRLGSIIQTQEVKCANEKKDIEYMLFDPAIATKAQIAMLNSMEDEIKDKEAKLEAAKMQVQASPEKDAKIAELQKSVVQAKLDLSDKEKQLADAQAKIQQAQASQADLVALKAELAKQTQQLADAQKQIQLAQASQADVVALKAGAVKQAQQLADAQAKAQQAQTIQADLASKDQTLASLKADIALKTQQLAEAQAKIQQATLAQSSVTAQKTSEVENLKAQLVQAQTQLATERTNTQQINLKAQSQQSAEQASAMAALQLQIQQANQKIIQLQNQISTTQSASLKTASMAAAVAPAAAAAEFVPANYAAPVATAKFKSMDEFSALLKNAGITVRGALQQVKGGDPSTYRAYSWKTDSLYGSAEMKKVSDAGQFDATVSQYLSRAKSRCAGEFAAVPTPTKSSESKAYEIACVGQNASSSASVLFTYSDNIATTVAHEGRAEAMDLAIDARDRVSSKIN